MDATLQKIVSRLEDITSRLEKIESGSGSANPSTSAPSTSANPSSGSANPFVQAYDDLVSGTVATWAAGVHADASLPEDARASAALVLDAFNALRSIVALAATHSAPDSANLQKILANLGGIIAKAGDLKSKAKRTDAEHHCAAVAESLGAMSWVCITPAPVPFVKEQNDAAEFYGNKVRVANKGSQGHIAYVDGLRGAISELAAYVKQHHTTGLSWNAKGPQATADAAANPGAAPAPPAGGPPPPPAPPANPPPMPAANPGSQSAGGGGGGMAALFSDLNKGSSVTSGLKKVTRDMTNKDKKISGAVSAPANPSGKAGGAKAPAGGAKKAAVPERLELDGSKWKVEGFSGRKDLVVEITSAKQVIYAYGLRDCVVTVKGKCNHITLDGCVKTGVLFDDVVAAVELVRCKSAQVQCNGTVPSMAIENSDGVHLYWLNPANNGCELITSQASEVNVTLKFDGDEEFSEIAVPQQYLTKVDAKALKTEPISHLG